MMMTRYSLNYLRCPGEVFEKMTEEGFEVANLVEAAELRQEYQSDCRKIQVMQRSQTNPIKEALPPCYYCRLEIFEYCRVSATDCKDFLMWVNTAQHIEHGEKMGRV